MYKTIFTFLTACFFVTAANAQTPVAGDLYEHLKTIINNMPGSGNNAYADPDDDALDKWDQVVNDVLAGEYAAADGLADDLGYSLIVFTDNTGTEDKVYYVLQRDEESENYWGTYVFNPTSCRTNLVIQSPHPKVDSNSGLQGAYIFSKLDAAAFFVSGTHRCNSSTASSCSGSTAVCGSNQAYRISDIAHNTTSIFQKTTEVVHEDASSTVFVQLHGFAKQASDPDAILSNGTRIEPSPDYIDKLVTELGEVDNSLTFKVGHQDFDWDRLLAFTNTQGRLVNGSTNACSTNATNSNGRFIHIEQSYDKLRSSTAAWDKMLEAMTATFTCGGEVTAVDPKMDQYRISPNPFKNYLEVSFTAHVDGVWVELYSHTGMLVHKQHVEKDEKIEVSNLDEGIYIYMLRNNEEIIDRKKLYKY